MIANLIVFFIQYGLGIHGVVYNALVITNMFAGPMRGTPNILILYQRDTMRLVVIRMAMNSLPKVELSTVFCCFEYQVMGDLLRKIRMPDWE